MIDENGGAVDTKSGPTQRSEDEKEIAKGLPSAIPGPDPLPFIKLFSTADLKDKALMVAGLIGACGAGVLMPLFAVLFGDFINAFGAPDWDDFTKTVSRLALKFTYLAIAACVAMYLEVTAFVLAGERQTSRLRARYLAAVLKQDIAFFDTSATTGGLLHGLNEDSLAVQAAISEKVSNCIHHMCTFVSGFIIAFTYGWDMTLVMLGCLPFLAATGLLIAKSASAHGKATAEAYSEASTIAQQSIASVRTVAAYNGQQAALDAYDKALSKPVRASFISSIYTGIALGGLQFIVYNFYAVAMFYGAYRIAAGKYSAGDVASVLAATLVSSFALGQAAPNITAFTTGCAAGARMFLLIERHPALKDVGDDVCNSDNMTTTTPTAAAATAGAAADTDHHAGAGGGGDVEAGGTVVAPYKGTGELSGEVAGRIDLSNVFFAYPARPDLPVFRGFTLEVPAGHTVALVGASGSGKSTAVQLIERFYDPQSGSVMLDGVDLRALKMTWLRSQIGIVSQEPTLFATSIHDNIAMGRQGATSEEVMAAATAANAHKFISLLPEGYHTLVGERGVQLSGGQKQRVAIARAILKNPKVLLLDEATSALDTQSERVVQAALDRMIVGRTTVVVAHRLSTIKHAHAIAVVVWGQVGEIGTHDELLAKPDGAYAALVQVQAASGAAAAVEEEEVDPDAPLSEQLLSDAPQNQGATNLANRSSQEIRRRSAQMVRRSAEFACRQSTDISRRQSTEVARRQSADIARRQSAEVVRRLSAELGRVTGLAGLHEVVVTIGLNSRVDIQEQDPEQKKVSEAEQNALDELKAKDVPFTRLLELNRPEWPQLAVGCIASACAGLQHPALAFVFSDMITVLFLPDTDELKSKASFYAWMFFVLACGALISVLLQQVFLGLAGSRLAHRIRTMLLGSLLRQEVAFFDENEHNSGRLTSALATDATYIRGAVADAMAVALQNLSTLVVGYLIAFAYNWQMALVVTGTFPILLAAMYLQAQWATGASSTSDKLYAGANQYITEAFSSIRTIHAYNLQPYITDMYSKMLESTRPVVQKQAHLGGIGLGFSFGMFFALHALIVWFGGWQLANDQTTLEGFFKGFLSILLAAMGMAQSGIAFPDLGKAKGAVGRVFPLLDRVPAIDPDAPGDEPKSEAVKGGVEFRSIKFAYPSRPSVLIYNDFSLTIPAGKVFALVGESGSGKSTVVSLLERFYDPLEGSVLLDGLDVRQYQLKWLRQQIGLVSQEPLLFAGTIADNIRYGQPLSTSLEELEAAAHTANASEFITRLPEGFNTRVGEGGIQLSGGQKQRIAIARAVMKNPKVLLLDEATSALDARSEQVVQTALDGVMAGRTCLVIAHRLSTIKNAHTISVLYRGAVLQQGTHSELMAVQDGAYSKLVAAQERAHA